MRDKLQTPKPKFEKKNETSNKNQKKNLKNFKVKNEIKV